MRDIAVYGGERAAQGAHRSEDASFHFVPPVSGETAAALDDRIDAASQQWRDGWRTAEQAGWSASPPQSKRCDGYDEDGHGGSASRAPSAPLARFLARERRGLSAKYRGTFPIAVTESPPDVVSQPVPMARRIKTHYTAAEMFRALSLCSAPFTHATQIADDLYTIAEYPTFTAEKRNLLRNVAIIADQLAGMAKNVFRMQSVCKMFGIVADLLEGKPLAPNDVLDVNTLSRSFIALDRERTSLIHSEIAKKGGAPQFRMNAPRVIEPKKTFEHGADGHHTKTLPGGTGSGASAGKPDADWRPMTSLELFYREPGEGTLTASVAEREEDRSGVQGKVENTLEGAVETPRETESGPSGQPGGAERLPEAEDRMMQRISAGMPPVAVQWTRVGSMPLRRRIGSSAQWEQVPAAEYAVGSIDARGHEEGEPFIDGGKTYLHLDGRAVAIRELLPGQWWIVNDPSPLSIDGAVTNRLPPLPLRKVAGGVAERFEIDEPVWVNARDAHDGPVGDDGYIRYRDRKFIDIGGKRVEAALTPIQGEEALMDFAKSIPEVLPAADAMQIIRLADGSRWLEGENGYYRLRYDLALGDFYVVQEIGGAKGIEPRRALVDFDLARRRWTALVGRRRRGYEDLLAARYVRVEEHPERSVEGEAEREQEGDASPSARALPSAGSGPAGRTDDVPSLGEGASSRAFSPFETEGVDLKDDEAIDDPAAPGNSGDSPAAGAELEHAPTFPLYVSSGTGLEREFALFGHYAQNLKRFPFFSLRNLGRRYRARGRLRGALRNTFDYLRETSMVAVNRMEPAIRAELAPLVLSLRQRLRGLYPSAEIWYGLTLQQKQEQVSHMVKVAYSKSDAEMWPCLTGYCNEIADVVLSSLIHEKPKLRDNLMQVALFDQRGTKGTHVMLIYADHPADLDVFADRASRHAPHQRQRPTLDEAAFYDWLIVNRDSTLLIDAWATNKLVDLSDATTHALVSHELMPNLMEAGFDTEGSPRFHVRAVLPLRPPNTVRPRREVDRARILRNAPATWEALAIWAVTGAPPMGASARALSADLMAAADSGGHDPSRQALLRTLAAEIAPSQGNGTVSTEPAGIDRRALVMAGRAAWALLDTPPGATVGPRGDRADNATDLPRSTYPYETRYSTETRQAVEATTIETATTPAAMATEATRAIDATNATDASRVINATVATSAPNALVAAAQTAEHERKDVERDRADQRLVSYLSRVDPGNDHSAVRQSGTHTYLRMPGDRYYAVREIMPGRLFIVDPDESPFGRPSLPPIPVERDGAVWRIGGGGHP